MKMEGRGGGRESGKKGRMKEGRENTHTQMRWGFGLEDFSVSAMY